MPNNAIIPIGNLSGSITTGGLVPGLPIWTGEASGSVASFPDGSNNPIILLNFSIVPVQAAGTPTPQAPIPIYGWNGAEIHRADGATPHIIDDVYNITWNGAGEVFGGYIEFKDGEWKAYKKLKKIILDGTQPLNNSTCNWRANADSVGWYYNLSDLDINIPPIGDIPNIYCDKAKPVSYNTIFSNNIDSVGLTKAANIERIVVRSTNITLTSAQAVNTYLSNNPITIVYEINTPIEIPLDEPLPTITTLLGRNNIWSNTGDINKVIYMRDWNIALNMLWEAVFG